LWFGIWLDKANHNLRHNIVIIFLTVVYAVSLVYLIFKIFEFSKLIETYHYKVIEKHSAICTKTEELKVNFTNNFAHLSRKIDQLSQKIEKLPSLEHVDYLSSSVSDEVNQLEIDIQTVKQELLDCYSKHALEIQKTKEISASNSKKTFDSLKKAFSRPTMVIREDD